MIASNPKSIRFCIIRLTWLVDVPLHTALPRRFQCNVKVPSFTVIPLSNQPRFSAKRTGLKKFASHSQITALQPHPFKTRRKPIRFVSQKHMFLRPLPPAKLRPLLAFVSLYRCHEGRCQRTALSIPHGSALSPVKLFICDIWMAR